MTARIILFLLSSAVPVLSQTNTAADPVFLTKAQREEAKKKADAEAVAAKNEAANERQLGWARAEMEKKALEGQREAERQAVIKKQFDDIAAKEEKIKARKEAVVNLRLAKANELASTPAERADYYHQLTPVGRTTPESEKKRLDLRKAIDDEVLKQPPPALSKPGTWRAYEVARGDSVIKIAAAHNMSLAELQEANTPVKENPIKIGQKLWVWADGKSQPTAEVETQIPRVQFPRKAGSSGEWRTYRVTGSGDTLSNIAQKQKMTFEQIKEGNPTLEENHTIPGGELIWVWEKPEQKVAREQNASEIIERDANTAARAASKAPQGTGGPTKKKATR